MMHGGNERRNPRARSVSQAAALGAALIAVFAGCSGPPEGTVLVERTMTVTAYCPCETCCSWRRTWYGKPVIDYGSRKGQRKAIGITASGRRARPGAVAADRTIPFGTVMRIPGYGKGVVYDRGGGINGEHIDVFFKSHNAARQWGRKELTVKLWLSPDHPWAS